MPRVIASWTILGSTEYLSPYTGERMRETGARVVREFRKAEGAGAQKI